MTTEELIATYDFEKSVLIGYYGGGNYGDELLLEVFENLFSKQGVQQLTIAYQTPKNYSTYHHDFGYERIEMGDKRQLLGAIRKNRNIVIGGGGLWGVDVNTNILLLGLILFFSRWILRKQVYLIGVGYYDSTSRLGRISAWFTAKSARYIIARDAETFTNFQKVSKRVSLGEDMAWRIPEIDLEVYHNDLMQLEKKIRINDKTLVITLRRFRKSLSNNYAEIITQYVTQNYDKNIALLLMEPRIVDPEGYEITRNLANQHKNVQTIDFTYNPIALFLFFRKYHKQLGLIGPQFHIIITAYLARVQFLPIVYDNKVTELFRQIKRDKTFPIQELKQADVQAFARNFYDTKA